MSFKPDLSDGIFIKTKRWWLSNFCSLKDGSQMFADFHSAYGV